MKGKIVPILTHFLAWVIFLALLAYLMPKPRDLDGFSYFIFPNILFIAFYYLNYYVLVPRLFIPRKYLIYGLICFASLIVTTVLPSLLFGHGPQQPHFNPPPPDMFQEMEPDFGNPRLHEMNPSFRIFSPDYSYAFFVFALILLLSAGLRMTRQWQQTEKERINAELAFLKAQINPHFLFNTLNNIHSMVISQSEKTSEAIEVFSDLLRFVIFETRNETVPLINKLQYISDYVTLQRMRLPATVEVNFKVEGNPHAEQIAPMILMPFIENAFKFGISTEKKSEIDILIQIHNHELLLSVKNPKFRRPDLPKESSQLGIGNTRKRLDLIYPGRHKLDIIETEGEFKVSLQINLK